MGVVLPRFVVAWEFIPSQLVELESLVPRFGGYQPPPHSLDELLAKVATLLSCHPEAPSQVMRPGFNLLTNGILLAKLAKYKRRGAMGQHFPTTL